MIRVVRKETLNQKSHYGLNFRSGNSEIVDLDRSSLCRASSLILDSSIVELLSRFNELAFLHLFIGLIFMSLMEPLNIFEQYIS